MWLLHACLITLKLMLLRELFSQHIYSFIALKITAFVRQTIYEGSHMFPDIIFTVLHITPCQADNVYSDTYAIIAALIAI